MNNKSNFRSEFDCLDSYEAEKLSSIFSMQKGNTLFVSEIVKTIGSEVVVRLKDGSHHSILLKDKNNAYQLSVFFKDLVENKGLILNTNYNQDKAIIFWKHYSD
jgi:hypothetical protein